MQHRKLHVAYVVELFTQGEERHVLGLLTDHLVILSNISVNTQNFKKKATQLALSVSQEWMCKVSFNSSLSLQVKSDKKWSWFWDFCIKMAGVLFEDIFDVKDIDPEGKKFDRGNI